MRSILNTGHIPVGLFFLSLLLYAAPVIVLDTPGIIPSIQENWYELISMGVWWIYFIPAFLLAYRSRFQGLVLVAVITALLLSYFSYRFIMDVENSNWFHGMMALASSLGGAIVIGVLAENFASAQEESRKQNEQLHSLFKNSKMLASCKNPEQVLDKSVEIIRVTLGFDYAEVWLLEGENNLRRAASNLPEECKLPEFFTVDSFLPGLALSSPEGVFVEDPQKDSRITDKKRAQKMGHMAEASVPITHKGEKLGILVVASIHRYPFTPEKRELLQTFSNQLALSLVNAKLFQELKKQATVDEMTGLYNYRYFQETLDKELKRTTREGSALGILMLDIDYFKEYNDTFGHPEGDRLLKEFGAVLRLAVRDTDIPVRYGGDEFAVILPNTDELGTHQLAQRILATVSGHSFPGEEKMPGQSISVSMGYATYPVMAQNKAELVKLADDHLYKVKEKRRRERKRLRF